MSNEELALHYQKEHDDKSIQEIYHNFQPLIISTTKAYGGGILSSEILEPEAKILITQAVNTFQPQKGSLSGHIKNYMKGINRIVNVASPIYIPEARASKMRMFTEERNILTKKLKRDPTYEEMADRLSLNINEIKRFSQESGKTLMSGGEIQETAIDHIINDKYFLEFVYNHLGDPNEKKVLEMVYGLHGTKTLKTNIAMAQKLGLSESGVRKIKDRIIKVVKEYE